VGDVTADGGGRGCRRATVGRQAGIAARAAVLAAVRVEPFFTRPVHRGGHTMDGFAIWDVSCRSRPRGFAILLLPAMAMVSWFGLDRVAHVQVQPT
jgi:hypothetical protein